MAKCSSNFESDAYELKKTHFTYLETRLLRTCTCQLGWWVARPGSIG
jgi:hypothetical protein